MARHFDNEREMHSRIAGAIAPALPHIEVLEVELDEPREKVTAYIDSPDGVGLDECEAVSHVLRDAGTCDEYELEISSPGLERPLRAPEHFAAHIGEPVRLRRVGTHRASNLVIASVDDTGVTFTTEDAGAAASPDGTDARHVLFTEIIRCKLVVRDPFAAAGRAGAQKGRS